MSRVFTDSTELVGSTPLVRIRSLAAGLPVQVVAKLEGFNPAGSAKDRIGLSIVDDAERRGLLRPGGRVVESTSGNTGIALAWVGALRGYRVTIVLPDSLSVERRALLRAFGAEVLLTPGELGLKAAKDVAEQIVAEDPTAFLSGQSDNPANPAAHRRTTAEEIWADTDGQVDILVAAVGTGGTITGVGQVLRERRPGVQVIGVEPAESALLTGGEAGPHKIQGIGGNLIPRTLDRDVYDEVVDVPSDAAIALARRAAREEGLLVGISSGAALWAALEVARRPENAGRLLVVVLPDTGERYLSTELFADHLD